MYKSSIILFKHSAIVAQNAYKIALKTDGLIDPQKAYIYGSLHDIGKVHLSKDKAYKHPIIGYKMMMESGDSDIATICISHPFPIFEAQDYLLHYCHDDEESAAEISSILKNVKNNIYIQLIQLCDKISGVEKYVTIEEKFAWYREKYNVSAAFVDRNYDALSLIKNRFDEIIGGDVYDIIR